MSFETPIRQKAPDCVVLGPFPPPVTGAAKNTQNMLDALRMNGIAATPVSTAIEATRESAGRSYHVQRLRRVLDVVRALRAIPGRGGMLYIVPDAGLGTWYSLLYTLVAVGRFRRIVFHHRSFLYITQPSLPMRLLVRLTRRKALHVCLSEDMASRFAAEYGLGPAAMRVAGNACFVQNMLPREGGETRTRSRIHLGHLSNLRSNKGFFDVVAVFERLAAAGVPVALQLAGPVTEAAVDRKLAQLKRDFPETVCHWGAVHGDRKVDFYRSLDLFMFPTHHPQEAQPNVVYEALAAGVPVLATPRACIPEMLVGECGAVSPTEDGFVDFAVGAIRGMTFEGVEAERRRQLILSWMRDEALRSQRHYLELLRELGAVAEPVKAPWS